MRPRILIAEPLDFSLRAKSILDRSADVTLQAVDSGELSNAFREYDAVWIRLATKITADMLGTNPRCRLLVTATTGLDHIDLNACRHLNINVLSLRSETDFLKQIRATAELTLALTLSLLRNIPAAAAAAARGEWNRDCFRGREVFGKTVGIVGMGRLGAIVAGYFRALGADVIGYDPRPDFPHEAARRSESLTRLLSQSDIVCVMVNYDAGTHHLLNDAALAAMKPGAVLVNTSRGGVIDERALIGALESKRLGGAALDVLDGEPNITAEHPLVQYAQNHSNLLLVPHIGGNTFESFEKTEIFLSEKVAALFEAA